MQGENHSQNKRSAEDALAPCGSRQRRLARGLWFPLLVVAAAAGTIAALLASDLTTDYRNTFIGLTCLAVFLLMLVWVALFAPLSRVVRWSSAALLLVLAAAPLTAFKPEFDGDMRIVRWIQRWAPARDAQLETLDISRRADLHTTRASDFPQFLGPDRRAIVEGVRLDPDWNARPPRQLWRQPIGVGASGFAIVNGFAVTQEQRGEEEMVVCYELATGDVVWKHADPVRFVDVMGGDGPRATPTIDNGRVYTLGATGILNCLDGATGEVVWRHNILDDAGAANLEWGVSGSPLVVDGLVILNPGGSGGKSVVAYHAESGKIAWSAGDDVASYASPAVAELDGVRQVLAVNQNWLVGHRLADGKLLWKHEWPGMSDSNASASQPVAIPGTDQVFVSKGYNIGAALLGVQRDASGVWQATPVWDEPTKPVMKTKITNVAIRDGLVFGLDAGVLQCIDLATGQSLWKKGRYGHGQLLLVGEYLLVTTETGEVALVAAKASGFEELGRFQAIEGRTWNNPALSGPYLLVRNHQEAACYELPLAQEPPLIRTTGIQ